MFILFSGKIEVFVAGKKVSSINKSGQLFGESCLISEKTPVTATLSYKKKNFGYIFVNFLYLAQKNCRLF